MRGDERRETRASDRLASQFEEGYSDRVERAEEQTTVLQAVQGLSDDEREVVALRFGADLTLKSIALALGESRTTIEARLYRALRKLRTESRNELCSSRHLCSCGR